MWAFGSWLMCFSGVLLDRITQLHHAEYKTLLRLCASVSGTLSPKICFYLKILMCISKCNGQVGLDVTLRSLEIHQRRLWSQHLFSCRWPPKCSSNVFISMDVCFHLFFRVSLTLVELTYPLCDRQSKSSVFRSGVGNEEGSHPGS